MIKALLLDLDLTLADTDKANKIAIQKLAIKINTDLSINSGEVIANTYIQAIYGIIPNHWHIDKKFDMNKKRCLFLQYALSDNNYQINNTETLKELHNYFNEIRMISFDFYEGVKEYLIELRKKYKLIVITNGPSYSQRPKIERLNLTDCVDAILIGGEEPHEKPHPSIFKKALSIYNLTPQECLHIGDSFEADIIGAENANIKSIWIKEADTSASSQKKKKHCYCVDKFLNIGNILALES